MRDETFRHRCSLSFRAKRNNFLNLNSANMFRTFYTYLYVESNYKNFAPNPITIMFYLQNKTKNRSTRVFKQRAI